MDEVGQPSTPDGVGTGGRERERDVNNVGIGTLSLSPLDGRINDWIDQTEGKARVSVACMMSMDATEVNGSRSRVIPRSPSQALQLDLDDLNDDAGSWFPPLRLSVE